MSVFTTDLGTISSQTIDEDRGWNLRTAAIAVVNKRRWTYAFASRSHFPRWASAVGVGGCSTLLCADKAQHNRSASARLDRREDRSEANWKSSGELEPLVPTLSLGEVAPDKTSQPLFFETTTTPCLPNIFAHPPCALAQHFYRLLIHSRSRFRQVKWQQEKQAHPCRIFKINARRRGFIIERKKSFF